VFEQSSRCDLVIPASETGHIPSHRISQPIIDIEQERDFHGVLNSLLRNARTHDGSDVLGCEAPMVECHLSQEPQRCAKLYADRRYRVLVQDLLDYEIAIEGGRRDRGVGIRSKMALIHARHECGEQLALAY
jgi:hypothetical protein